MDSILNWCGGKSLSAKKIVELMPEHFCYVEAFFGAGWIFYSKPPSKVEVVNDVNGELINFWRVIQRQPEKFLERSKYEMYSRDLFHEYYKDFYSGEHYKLSDLEKAFRFFCMIKEAFASGFGKGWGYGQSRNQANAFFNEFKLVDEVAKRLKYCQIDNKDFQSVIEDYDNATTLVVVDPPYIKSDVDAQYFKSMGANNIVGFTLHDHQRLYTTLIKMKGKFILTIDDAPFIRDRYCEGEQGSRGFWWQENVVHYSSAAGPDRRHATELIITNYDTEPIIKSKQNVKKESKKESKKEESKSNSASLLDF